MRRCVIVNIKETLCGGEFRVWWDAERHAVVSSWRPNDRSANYGILIPVAAGGEASILDAIDRLRESARFTAHKMDKTELIACANGRCGKDDA